MPLYDQEIDEERLTVAVPANVVSWRYFRHMDHRPIQIKMRMQHIPQLHPMPRRSTLHPARRPIFQLPVIAVEETAPRRLRISLRLKEWSQ